MLFLIEVTRKEDDTHHDVPDEEGDESELEISLRALNGKVATDTMRIVGLVKGKKVFVLIDSRITHNCLSKEVVDHM